MSSEPFCAQEAHTAICMNRNLVQAMVADLKTRGCSAGTASLHQVVVIWEGFCGQTMSDSLPCEGVPPAVEVYNAMLSGYSREGDVNQAGTAVAPASLRRES